MKNKIPMYQCESIWNGETNQIENCTCGRCAESYHVFRQPIEQEILSFVNSMLDQWVEVALHGAVDSDRAKDFVTAYKTVKEHIETEIDIRKKIKEGNI